MDRLCYCERPLIEHDGRCECAKCPEKYKSACKQKLPDDAPMDDIGLAVSLWEACECEVLLSEVKFDSKPSMFYDIPYIEVIINGKSKCVTGGMMFEELDHRPDLSHDLVAELIWPRVDVDDDRIRLPYIWALEHTCAKYGLRPDFAPAWAHCVAFLITREAR